MSKSGATAADRATDRAVLGIGLSFLAFAALSSADALTKILSATYSPFEVAVVDGLAALLVSLPYLIRQDGLGSLRPRRIGAVVLRCALGAASLMLAILAFSMIPMADAYSLGFIAPLAVTALSVPVLGEHVGAKQWIAVILGFAAVIVVLRPDFGAIGLGQINMLGSAILFALSMLILRRIAKTESSGALLLVYFAMLVLIGLPMAILNWKTPDLQGLALMLLTGICAGIGNIFLINAFRNASATIVSSFMYTQLIWGTIFGLALFGDLPDVITLAGAGVIMLCGIYTLIHASKGAEMRA